MNHYYQNEFGDAQAMYDQCQQYMNYHVTLSMKDGQHVDGIIQSVGNDGVHVLVGEDVMDRDDQDERYFAGGGYGYPGRRYRRFRPQFFPLASLAALALLPYAYPYPYPYPPYPPYPYPYY
ncbi:hypothetical protein [Halalkalibacter okhensis]|uniref:Uncharacterized protein n=1 Tax=Halalkalibacter okhensis TaxID=333138 RepID=A0A0B0ID90_9BACI|nr:hypothetical protein [Halalkalibacter okhensis]KHF40548.1 hypothetical protein LQ50_08455 [Halalkalibacter okhensis]